jgi:hypothetical protein
MTDAELASYQYSHREDPLGDEAEFEEVEIAHPLSVSMSFRLPPEEVSAIRAAAERAGMKSRPRTDNARPRAFLKTHLDAAAGLGMQSIDLAESLASHRGMADYVTSTAY